MEYIACAALIAAPAVLYYLGILAVRRMRRRPVFVVPQTADYPPGCGSDPLPCIVPRAIPLEPLYERRGRKYVEATAIRGRLFRRTVRGKRVQYVAVGG